MPSETALCESDAWQLFHKGECTMNVRLLLLHRHRRPLQGFAWGAVALALCAALLAGCGLFAPPTPTPEPITINFAFPAQLANYYDELIQTFNEEHPSLTVQRKTARSSGTWNSLFQSGEVDVFTFLSEDEFFADLYQQGRVLNLSPLIQGDGTVDLDDIYPSLLEPYDIRGSVWAIPAGANLAVIYYNKDIFDRNNAAYPALGWTWADLQMAAMSVRDPDAGVYGLVSFPFAVIPFVYQHGGRVVDDWRAPTRLQVDDPLTIEAVEWYASLIHDHDVMPSPQEMESLGGDRGPGYVFWRQKTGMYLGFFSDRGGETWGRGARWPMNWGMVPLPRDAHASTLGFVLAYAAAADTQHPQACWEWITYLSHKPPPFVVPARRSLAESNDFRDQVGAEAAAIARASIEDAMIVSNVQIPGLAPQTGSFDETMEAILNGDVDALSALTELQQQVGAQ
jgi:ABC-type glycerol-3-phosphate transport system substrate-binding protein